MFFFFDKPAKVIYVLLTNMFVFAEVCEIQLSLHAFQKLVLTGLRLLTSRCD